MSGELMSARSESDAPRAFQFGLRGLLAAVAAIAVGLAVGGYFGAAGVFFLVATLSFAATLYLRQKWPTFLLVGLTALVLGAIVMLLSEDRVLTFRSQCKNQLKQIGLALLNYHDTYGCFPPAYIADERGRPMHSWRVLILPQLEYTALYSQYRFDEPWDGPHNRLLHNVVIDAFQCPEGTGATPGMTDYLAVVGPGTVWPGATSMSHGDIVDDPGQTIAVVEAADSDVVWCEPRDLHVVQMSPRINPQRGQGISSHHEGGAHVLMADGSVQFLQNLFDPGSLRALLTRDGGEQVNPSPQSD